MADRVSGYIHDVSGFAGDLDFILVPDLFVERRQAMRVSCGTDDLRIVFGQKARQTFDMIWMVMGQQDRTQ